eukprot:gnl/Spiro4/5239_TR2645_c0_g2_i1.p1 gnl/Spiro4/5239_TR2645_c0_g2~~gnl/Spiro4/5239_TR2645_c0_g2_i1.p1  ORF type:complete len:161 (+),score=28.68 gnl/Spiro4/5239_TR2645_c0_g2_i1:34-516(+)
MEGPPRARAPVIHDPVWQYHAFETWVRTVLIVLLAEPNASVADFFCGYGTDVGKYDRAHIRNYLAIAPVEAHLAAARERYSSKNQPFTADFKLVDLRVDHLSKHISGAGSFDCVSMQNALQKCFATRESLTSVLSNVSWCLRTGGFFFFFFFFFFLQKVF